MTSPPDPERRGGTITVQVEGGAANVKCLADREILVDFRPGAGVRVSPHFYTTDEELLYCLDELKSIQESKEYEKYVSGTAAY